MRWLVGDEVASVQAMTATLDKKDSAGKPITVEDNAAAVLMFRGGVLGVPISSWT